MRAGATQIAADVRSGRRRARDVVAQALAAATAQQERLNAYTFIDEERALARATAIDRDVAAGKDPGPLCGVPVALKDIIDHAGRTTTCGSAFFRRDATQSATVVERIEGAGGILIGRTGLHEFAYGFSSENPWFGPVRSPLDPTLSPGGSSGGSAAAVAAGQVSIGIGTDTGGSVRVPAALCGLYGLKVTHGRVPLTGVFPLAASLDTVGPIAATVEDLALAYRVTAGYDATDPWSAARTVTLPGTLRRDLTGLRVGVPQEWIHGAPATADTMAALTDALGRLCALGAVIEEIRDPSLDSHAKGQYAQGAEVATVHRAWLSEGRSYGPDVADRIGHAMKVTLDQYVAAQAWRAEIRQRARLTFDRCDVLATPATGATRKVIGVDAIDTPSGPHPYRVVLSCFSALVNHLGCPAIVGPLARGTVPPPGLQLIAPWWQEHRLLEIAATLEHVGVFALPLAV